MIVLVDTRSWSDFSWLAPQIALFFMFFSGTQRVGEAARVYVVKKKHLKDHKCAWRLSCILKSFTSGFASNCCSLFLFWRLFDPLSAFGLPSLWRALLLSLSMGWAPFVGKSGWRGGPCRWMVGMLVAVLDSNPIPALIRMAAKGSSAGYLLRSPEDPSLAQPHFGGDVSDQHVGWGQVFHTICVPSWKLVPCI